ncbi:MAG TPA: SWIM zinc finger family protein, partial [Caldilineaceae bacterium]|nr:SWIM zinc finger family protein [Caldilineaceae bacterium]
MPTLESLSNSDLSQLFTRSSLAKARSYIPRAGSLVRRGNQLTAKVMGTRMYDVEIQVTDSAIYATCTCPVGGGCKHIGAVFLRWVESPRSFRVEEADPTETVGPLEVNAAVVLPPTPPKAQPGWLTESFAARQSREQGILRTMLEHQTVADIRQIASARGWRLSGTRKADIVDQLLAQMESMGETAKAIYSLDAEDQQVLRSIALHSGSRVALGRTVEQTALAQGPLSKFEKATAYLYHLLEVGLAFSASGGSASFSQFSGFPADFVPFTLGRIFPPLLETV